MTANFADWHLGKESPGRFGMFEEAKVYTGSSRGEA